jgi:hypothetical protein
VPGGPPVFKTGGRRAAPSAGSIPVRLRAPASARLTPAMATGPQRCKSATPAHLRAGTRDLPAHRKPRRPACPIDPAPIRALARFTSPPTTGKASTDACDATRITAAGQSPNRPPPHSGKSPGVPMLPPSARRAFAAGLTPRRPVMTQIRPICAIGPCKNSIPAAVQIGGYLRAGRDRRQSRSVTYLGFSVRSDRRGSWRHCSCRS